MEIVLHASCLEVLHLIVIFEHVSLGAWECSIQLVGQSSVLLWPEFTTSYSPQKSSNMAAISLLWGDDVEFATMMAKGRQNSCPKIDTYSEVFYVWIMLFIHVITSFITTGSAVYPHMFVWSNFIW